ncbi:MULTISPECIES: hypothetical protein [unclassified Bradyrhizobium]|uniref:hypothetical protein n=1 Tax=unclassified Bradyrhizobium TaxID=2631580 RepID=UPI0028E6AB6D|nr:MULTISPECIES: hypothetical protein [unclassified Bradyrhizobium]
MAYTMIAERDNQKVRKQRESALIVLANARVLENQGWQVVIVNDDGKDFNLAAFEAGLAQKFSSWFQATTREVSSPADGDEAAAEATEALVAAELVAEAMEAEEHELQEVDESDFDDLEGEDAERESVRTEPVDAEQAVLDEIALEIATVD